MIWKVLIGRTGNTIAIVIAFPNFCVMPYDAVVMRKNVQSIRREIDKMVKLIVSKFSPDQIILFGSHARGDADADSDVDLLVVMAVDGSKRKKQLEMRSALGNLNFPLDIVLSKPEDFDWRKDYIGTVEHPAWREGKVLYSAR